MLLDSYYKIPPYILLSFEPDECEIEGLILGQSLIENWGKPL